MLISRADLTRPSSSRGLTNSRAKGKGPPHDPLPPRERLSWFSVELFLTTGPLKIVARSRRRRNPRRARWAGRSPCVRKKESRSIRYGDSSIKSGIHAAGIRATAHVDGAGARNQWHMDRGRGDTLRRVHQPRSAAGRSERFP
jgi:hypothetical protein